MSPILYKTITNSLMKLKFNTILVMSICLCSLSTQVNAQAAATQYFVPTLFPRSPTSTAMEKYGSYPVNEFTGIPDISIPLYTIEAGGLKLPITLSYHASGNKIADVASWAGLGWSVSDGGQITRRIMGKADDIANGYLFGTLKPQGSFSNTNYLDLEWLENVANGTYDARPDLYSYDFPGSSGKFFFDGSPGQNYAVRTLPFSPIKIEHKMNSFVTGVAPLTTGLVRFNITDVHGNNYIFGDEAMEWTFSESGGASNGMNVATAWKMKSMMSQDRRDTISFTYNGHDVGIPVDDTEIFTVVDNVINNGSGAYTPSYPSTPSTIGNLTNVYEQVPAQINFKNGKVVFELDTAKRQDIRQYGHILKNIKVYSYNFSSKAYEVQKTIRFFTSYFGTPGNSRLRLDSIEMQDKTGSVVQHYRFDYNQTMNMPSSNYQQDYWGYYNGKANNMLTPQQTIVYNPFDASPENIMIGSSVANGRDCDSNFMQVYMLTGIHYPTGGYTTFTYQTNRNTVNSVTSLAGGLRIKTISSYDGVSPIPIVHTYQYNSTQKTFFLDYTSFLQNQSHRYYTSNLGAITAAGTCNMRTFVSVPHCDLEAYDATTVVYPSVTEYIGTPTSNIGKTDYTFTYAGDTYGDISFYAGSLIYLSAFYERGKLLTQKDYIRNANGTYNLAKSVTNTYTAFTTQDHYRSVGLAVKKYFYNDGAATSPIAPGTAIPDDQSNYMWQYYDIFSGDMYLTSSTSKNYDINDTTKSTSSTTSYTYSDTTHQQVTQATHIDSKGNTRITNNKYAFNYTAGNAVLDSMVNRHMYAQTIEKAETYTIGTATATTSAQLNQFKYGSIPFTIVPDTVSILNIPAPVPDFTPSGVSSGHFTKDGRYARMISFDQYDLQNNLTQYTPRNSTPVTALWDYQYNYPIAQVKNAASNNVAYTSFEADGKGNFSYTGATTANAAAPTGSRVYALSGGAITSTAINSAKAYVLSYMSSSGPATVSNGATGYAGTAYKTTNGWTYYEHAIPAGVTGITISGAVTIDELRLYPVDAQITTYTFNPAGLSSITDTKGQISYFDYDSFNRLMNIKDKDGNIVKHMDYHYQGQ
jgi:hypothetical protein